MQNEKSILPDVLTITTGNSSYSFHLNSNISDDLSLSPTDYSFHEDDVTSVENRLHQASFILQYQHLYNRHALALSRLHDSLKEIESLREQNTILRLSLLSQATVRNFVLSSGHRQSMLIDEDFNRFGIGSASRDSHVTDEASKNLNMSSVTRVMQRNDRFERRNPEKILSLPKTISVRSSGYMNTPRFLTKNSHLSSSRVASPSIDESQRVYVGGARKDEEELEMDVYKQGMLKTEVCNKWQETGTCPYGDHCRFAHGMTELRPVIRHPRYKTEACRIVLAGDICPYGHRCHFRHSLTHQD